jgi:hypothetical protein
MARARTSPLSAPSEHSSYVARRIPRTRQRYGQTLTGAEQLDHRCHQGLQVQDAIRLCPVRHFPCAHCIRCEYPADRPAPSFCVWHTNLTSRDTVVFARDRLAGSRIHTTRSDDIGLGLILLVSQSTSTSRRTRRPTSGRLRSGTSSARSSCERS